MKKFVLYGLMTFCLFFIPASALPAPPVSVEILYMNHGPLQETIRNIRALCGGYGKALIITWYDSDSTEGEKFMAQKGIHEHVPLVIWIAGKSTVKIKGKDVLFVGFPTGSGPAFFQGKWTLSDLRAALDQTVPKK
jgi:hypothetical protein